MRLGQLARKLAVRPSQIVDYLSARQIFSEEGSNARLSDEITERIVLHFDPSRLSEIMAVEEKVTEQAAEPMAALEEVNNISQTEKIGEAEVVTANQVVEMEDNSSDEKAEVIKAPKIELTGLKVLGKIELPEPRKKSEPVAEAIEETDGSVKLPASEKKPGRQKRNENPAQRRDNYTQRPARNPIAVQREQKTRDEEEKRKMKAERDKGNRTQHYLNRVKLGQPTKAMKIVSEPMESFSSTDLKPAPTTWFGKFLRWLNT